MPLFASNFTSNSLSGTVRVSGGAANISFGIAPIALEGSKSFVVKLRRGSEVGDVLATSNPITINDFSQVVSLTANISTVAEGNLVSVSLVTANVPNNANVFYSVFPVTANVTASDFFGANAGMVTINNNQATFALYANTDAGYSDETGETFTVQLRTNGTSGNIVYTTSNIAITDFYKLYNIISLVESSSTVTEGGSLTFTITGHNIPTGTILYYNTEGNATSSLFTTGNTGSFVMNSVSNTITLATTSTVFTNETRNFALKIRSGSSTGTVVGTSNTVAILDSALSAVTATGGTIIDGGGYRTHVFTSNATFSATTGVTNTIEYFVVAGGGGGGSVDAGGGSYSGGGGGAGGVLTGNLSISGNFATNVIVGGGGFGAGQQPGFPTSPVNYNMYLGANGSPSVFYTAEAIGGGGGGTYNPNDGPWSFGKNGGSGGGYAHTSQALNAPYIGKGVPGQGYPGGRYVGANTPPQGAGGGGGAGEPGHNNGTEPVTNSNIRGGFGIATNIAPPAYGTPGPTPGRWFGGGGGGGTEVNQPFPGGTGSLYNAGGTGGGGAGGGHPTSPESSKMGNGANATVNTGGGGGGGAGSAAPSGGGKGGNGGSGIVILRYAYTPPITYSSVTANSSIALEGSNVFFVVNTLNANAFTIYYDTIGNVTSASFVGGNTGSFVVTGNSTVLRLETTSTIPTNEERSFALRIREDSATTGNIRLVSSNVFVYDQNVSIYYSATGGNVITSGGYRIHTFTTSNSFVVSSAGKGSLEYIAVAGGAGGGSGDAIGRLGGGGGAGGYLTGTATISAGTYAIAIGGGGAGGAPGGPQGTGGITGTNGSNTGIFGNLYIAIGGGGGAGGRSGNNIAGAPGGSGGGGQNDLGGTGVPGQGNPGGVGGYAGGGGAGQAGQTPGKGGDGANSSITGSLVTYAGGGGGGGGGTGGAGGGGPGGASGASAIPGTNATVNTGGGGGGGNTPNPAGPGAPAGLGGAGGSGIVIIRYPV